jgi:hypothetical protein
MKIKREPTKLAKKAKRGHRASKVAVGIISEDSGGRGALKTTAW